MDRDKLQFDLWGQEGDPTITTTEHEDISLHAVEFEGFSGKLGEVSITTTDPAVLREIATFFTEQADAMERMGEDYDHVHFRGRMVYPDIIVIRPREQ